MSKRKDYYKVWAPACPTSSSYRAARLKLESCVLSRAFAYFGIVLAVVQVLGVANDATERDLKRAYHKLALEFHPDKVAAEQKEDAEKKFREIAEVPLAPRSERRRLCGMRTRGHICIVCTKERTGGSRVHAGA